jgi:Ca2+-binding RTX toxin-like protein
MRFRSTRHPLALLASVAMMASLAATVAGPVSAADTVTCLGKVATIVGTPGPDVLLGTNGRDVIAGLGGNDIIAGRGGNDLICGGRGKDRIVGNGGRDVLLGNAGPDRVVGGAGPDVLAGGVGDDILVGRAGNDGLDGGPGTDVCLQSQGTGPKVRCELPAVKVVPPEVKPDPIDLANVIAIAYTDLNRNGRPDAGDVMIAQLVDTDANGPDIGDSVEMGLYPTKHQPTWPADFAAWDKKDHTVNSVFTSTVNQVRVEGKIGASHSWYRIDGSGASDQYAESIARHSSNLCDGCASGSDALETRSGSPSEPTVELQLESPGTGDDYFIEVELYLP